MVSAAAASSTLPPNASPPLCPSPQQCVPSTPASSAPRRCLARFSKHCADLRNPRPPALLSPFVTLYPFPFPALAPFSKVGFGLAHLPQYFSSRRAYELHCLHQRQLPPHFQVMTLVRLTSAVASELRLLPPKVALAVLSRGWPVRADTQTLVAEAT